MQVMRIKRDTRRFDGYECLWELCKAKILQKVNFFEGLEFKVEEIAREAAGGWFHETCVNEARLNFQAGECFWEA